jgi:hypothetical protein
MDSGNPWFRGVGLDRLSPKSQLTALSTGFADQKPLPDAAKMTPAANIHTKQGQQQTGKGLPGSTIPPPHRICYCQQVAAGGVCTCSMPATSAQEERDA